MATSNGWFHARGTLTREGWQSVVDAQLPAWVHTGLRVAELPNGERIELSASSVERLVVPLAGGCVVEYCTPDAADPTGTIELAGRTSVFEGPSDVLYLPIGTSAVLTAVGVGDGTASRAALGPAAARVAVAEAPATVPYPVQLIRRDDVPVELRGAGHSSRQVHNFGTPDRLRADKLIVCEVITPAENWSSYPPHKHDEQVDGRESRLEEIYYFESAVARGVDATADAAPFGMFTTYASPAGEVAIDAMVRTGDIALVPHGYHGPAVAAPGYDLYYLNVMAGPDPERAWLISDDPAHAWIRSTWEGQQFDPRLPYAPTAVERPTEGR